MYMSLFFLSLTIVTYTLSVLRAKNSSPDRNKFSTKKNINFYGQKEKFENRLADWAKNNPRFNYTKKSNHHFIIEEKTHLFSYGYFYHFLLTEKKECLTIEIIVQPKLISSVTDKLNLFSFLEDTEIKNAS